MMRLIMMRPGVGLLLAYRWTGPTGAQEIGRHDPSPPSVLSKIHPPRFYALSSYLVKQLRGLEESPILL